MRKNIEAAKRKQQANSSKKIHTSPKMKITLAVSMVVILFSALLAVQRSLAPRRDILDGGASDNMSGRLVFAQNSGTNTATTLYSRSIQSGLQQRALTLSKTVSIQDTATYKNQVALTTVDSSDSQNVIYSVYYSDDAGQNYKSLYVSNERSQPSYSFKTLQFSSDGKSLFGAAINKDNKAAIIDVPLDGSQVKELFSIDAGILYPIDYRKDKQKIIYTKAINQRYRSGGNTNQEVNMYDLATKTESVLYRSDAIIAYAMTNRQFTHVMTVEGKLGSGGVDPGAVPPYTIFSVAMDTGSKTPVKTLDGKPGFLRQIEYSDDGIMYLQDENQIKELSGDTLATVYTAPSSSRIMRTIYLDGKVVIVWNSDTATENNKKTYANKIVLFDKSAHTSRELLSYPLTDSRYRIIGVATN